MNSDQWWLHASRVGTVASLGLALMFVMWPEGPVRWTFKPDRAIVLAAALGAWANFEWRTLRRFQQQAAALRVLSPRDKALLDRFEALIGARALSFIRCHDFGNSFARVDLDPFFDLADDWKGARLQFSDPELRQLFSDVLAKGSKFANLAATKTHAHNGNPNVASVRLAPQAIQYNPAADQIEEEAAQQLGEAARELLQSIEKFTTAAHARRETPMGGTGGDGGHTD